MTACQFENPDYEHYKTGVLMGNIEIKFPNASYPLKLKKGKIVTICGVCQWYADPMTPYVMVLLDDNAVPVPILRDAVLITNENDRN